MPLSRLALAAAHAVIAQRHQQFSHTLYILQVAERGLQFVHTFAQLLAEQQAASVLPQLFREAWAFSACISLATTTSRLMGASAALNKKAPDAPPSPVTQLHRYSPPD